MIKPEIEIFDYLIYLAAELYKNKKINGKPYIQFVMGIKNAALDKVFLTFI